MSHVNPPGLSPITSAARSIAMPTRPIVPSSKSRPISVTPCGTRRGGSNFGSGFVRVGRPVAARLRHLHESRAQRERRMAREVGDGQHLVAQRRHEQQIHLAEDTPPSPARPAGAAGRPARSPPRRGSAPRGTGSATRRAPAPSAGHALPLSVSSSNAAAASAKSTTLSESYGQLGSSTGVGTMPSLLDEVERGAVDVGGGALVHPGGEVADAQAIHRRARVEVETARHARDVAGVGAR